MSSAHSPDGSAPQGHSQRGAVAAANSSSKLPTEQNQTQPPRHQPPDAIDAPRPSRKILPQVAPSCYFGVESRRGAVAWAMRHRPVSPPRSSNRTGRFPASGFPTGFIARLTVAAQCARVEDAARPTPRRRTPGRSVACRVLAPCADGRGSVARDHRRDGRWLGTPSALCRS